MRNKNELSWNAELFERVQELSNYDELTKLPVRRFFAEKFAEEMDRSKRFDLIMSLIILDIDSFSGTIRVSFSGFNSKNEIDVLFWLVLHS